MKGDFIGCGAYLHGVHEVASLDVESEFMVVNWPLVLIVAAKEDVWCGDYFSSRVCGSLDTTKRGLL